MAKLLSGTRAEAERIGARSRARLKKSGEESIPTAVTMVQFELAAASSPPSDS